MSVQQLGGESSPQGTIQQVSNDEIYLLKDFVVVQIENRLFKIPRHHLIKQSRVFLKWSSDEMNPTIVLDVTLREFRDFLQILLPGFSTTDLSDFWRGKHQPSEEVWTSVLKLSTKWFCLEMYELAIRKLPGERWPPAKSIALGRKFYVKHWVISGYKNLLTRHASISDEEATDIGLHESLQIMRMRETPYFGDYVEVEIERVFKDELASLEARSSAFISSPFIRGTPTEFLHEM